MAIKTKEIFLLVTRNYSGRKSWHC